jgi:hypothetical protein
MNDTAATIAKAECSLRTILRNTKRARKILNNFWYQNDIPREQTEQTDVDFAQIEQVCLRGLSFQSEDQNARVRNLGDIFEFIERLQIGLPTTRAMMVGNEQ